MGELGCDGHGLERADYPVPADTGGIRYYLGELSTQGFTPESFDLVVIWHVLEHLSDPVATVHQAAAMLRPGGVLALAVPNFSSRQARWFGADWFHLDLPRHLWHFRADDLRQICQPQGLHLRASSGRSLDQNPFGFLQSTLNRLVPGAPNRLFRGMQGGPGRQRWSLPIWGLLATPLLPLAMLEYLLSAGPDSGATLIQYWGKG